MEARHPVGGLFSREFLAFVIIAELWRPEDIDVAVVGVCGFRHSAHCRHWPPSFSVGRQEAIAASVGHEHEFLGVLTFFIMTLTWLFATFLVSMCSYYGGQHTDTNIRSVLLFLFFQPNIPPPSAKFSHWNTLSALPHGTSYNIQQENVGTCYVVARACSLEQQNADRAHAGICQASSSIF